MKATYKLATGAREPVYFIYDEANRFIASLVFTPDIFTEAEKLALLEQWFNIQETEPEPRIEP